MVDVTKEQALNAISYLQALGDDAIGRQQRDSNLNNDYVCRNAHMLASSIEVLTRLVNQVSCAQEGRPEPTIKIVYEYKLRRGDGKYMNRSNWDKKGKTYSKRNNLAVALGTYISNTLDYHPDKPKTGNIYNQVRSGIISESEYKSKYALYLSAYRVWQDRATNDKEFRASQIPEDWTVICIPVNTKADIIEINARDWYKGKQP